MQVFTYSYPTKVYFGEGAAASALAQELPKAGRTGRSDRMGRRPGTVRPGPNRDRPQSGQEAWRARIFGGRFFRPDAYTALWRGVFRLAGLVDMGQSQFAQGVLVVEAGISGVQNVHHVELCQTGGHGPIAEK